MSSEVQEGRRPSNRAQGHQTGHASEKRALFGGLFHIISFLLDNVSQECVVLGSRVIFLFFFSFLLLFSFFLCFFVSFFLSCSVVHRLEVTPSRLCCVSAAVETGSYRCNAAVESRSEWHKQWKNGHVAQYQHSTSERISKTSRNQGMSNQ